MNISDILERAADRLSKPGAWTQGSFARNRLGERVYEDSDSAVCWCAAGAIGAVTPDEDEYEEARQFLIASLRLHSLADWNDAPNRKQSEVVAKLRQAAAKAREAEPTPSTEGRTM